MKEYQLPMCSLSAPAVAEPPLSLSNNEGAPASITQEKTIPLAPTRGQGCLGEKMSQGQGQRDSFRGISMPSRHGLVPQGQNI